MDYLWTRKSRIQCATLKQEKGRIPLNASFIFMGRENTGGGEGLMLALILVTHLVVIDGNRDFKIRDATALRRGRK